MTTFERFFINLSTLIVGVSGLIYAFMKYMMTGNDPFAVVNHPLQPWMLDIHVLAAPAMVFAVGLIARDHIVAKLRAAGGRSGRGTGLVAVSCLLPMIATGYLVQVFTHETARGVSVGIHLGTGLTYLVVFTVHLVLSLRGAARKARNGAPREVAESIGGIDGPAGRVSTWGGSPRS